MALRGDLELPCRVAEFVASLLHFLAKLRRAWKACWEIAATGDGGKNLSCFFDNRVTAEMTSQWLQWRLPQWSREASKSPLAGAENAQFSVSALRLLQKWRELSPYFFHKNINNCLHLLLSFLSYQMVSLSRSFIISCTVYIEGRGSGWGLWTFCRWHPVPESQIDTNEANKAVEWTSS